MAFLSLLDNDVNLLIKKKRKKQLKDLFNNFQFTNFGENFFFRVEVN